MQKEWNLQQLAYAASQDLRSCHTDLERVMANTINRKEMMDLWQTMKAQGRKPTPGDIAIAEHWGLN